MQYANECIFHIKDDIFERVSFQFYLFGGQKYPIRFGQNLVISPIVQHYFIDNSDFEFFVCGS
jgi:hypothetical protein